MAKKKRQEASREEGASYLAESRTLSLSIVSIIPLVILYHCGIVQSGYAVRNMAEVWLEGPLRILGLHAAHVVNVALILALVAVLLRTERTRAPIIAIAFLMVAEGALYALALFKGGERVTNLICDSTRNVVFALNLEAAAPICLALGAGVYEELLFRLLLVGGGAWALRKVFLWNRPWSLGVMLVISSLLFSAAHHLGPLGEPVQAYNFVFRAVCGLMLGMIYVTRGLGVAVWTHALYNALVVV